MSIEMALAEFEAAVNEDHVTALYVRQSELI